MTASDGGRPVGACAAPRAGHLTVRQLWEWLSDRPCTARLLEWPPDVAALTTAVLQRSQAFRFVVSPPAGAAWPPTGPTFAATVTEAARRWRAAPEIGSAAVPDLVARAWATVEAALDTPVADLVEGRPWPLCEALLTLHAVADEAAAGCGGGSLGPSPADGAGSGAVHVARARELLARTGSMAALPTGRVVHLPKVRTTPVGMTHRSLSRYSCTTTDGIPAVWHRAPLHLRAAGPALAHANVLLLPWPLRVHDSDFVPVPASVHRPEREPFGFFTYEPSEVVDLDLVDRLLDAALAEVGRVDAVVLPEGVLAEPEVAPLEAVLGRRGVGLLVSGVRVPPVAPDRFPGNAVHIGVHVGDQWWHHRQNKHHRWFLQGAQVEQYDLGGALHPAVRWWEAMDVPPRSVHLLELGSGLTLAAVVCEDLARLDGVADLLRSVGPSLVVTLLLDGPQLQSRWTGRYAGVLADDPGSAVLTITAGGFVSRSRPPGFPPSDVVAMWKDPLRGVREIPLEAGAQGVLLTTVAAPSGRYAADGRAPVDDVTDLSVAGLHQVRAAAAGAGAADGVPNAAAETGAAAGAAGTGPGATQPRLDGTDLSVLVSWGDAVAQGLTGSCDLGVVLRAAAPGASWRPALGLAEPSSGLAEAALARRAEGLRSGAGGRSVAQVRAALDGEEPGPAECDRLADAVLRAGLRSLDH
jgi:hypothetical protein